MTHVIEGLSVAANTAHEAINRLEQAGVIKQVTVGRRNRAWEAVGLLSLVDSFERRLATPGLDDGGRPVREAPFRQPGDTPG